MCQFKSGIVLKNKVLTMLEEDSHAEILKHFNIKDEMTPPDFVKVELVPIDGDVVNGIHNLNFKTWELKVDQDTIPDWWEASKKWAEKEMMKALKETVKKRCVLRNQKIKEIKDGERWILVCGHVDYICGIAHVGNICGTAHVGNICGTAHVGNICDTAHVDNICDTAHVDYIYDTAHVDNIYGTAHVGNICGTAHVDYIYDTAHVDYIKDYAIVFLSRKNGVITMRTADDAKVEVKNGKTI